MFGCKPCSGGASTFFSVIAVTAVAIAGTHLLRMADAEPPATPAAQAQHAAAPARSGAPDVGALLVNGLKATEGCLGVDTAKFRSGKSTIFAWFENKEALLRWYHSEAHIAAMSMFLPDHEVTHAPLSGIPAEYTGPVLAIAAMTMASPEEMQKGGAPFSQISIELYSPLKGGLHINGTLAPASMIVPGGEDVGAKYESKPQ